MASELSFARQMSSARCVGGGGGMRRPFFLVALVAAAVRLVASSRFRELRAAAETTAIALSSRSGIHGQFAPSVANAWG